MTSILTSLLLQKAKIHRCTFCQKKKINKKKMNLWGKQLQKMAGCNKYMTYTSHARLNLSFVMNRVECLSLTACINEINVRVPVLDTVLYRVLSLGTRKKVQRVPQSQTAANSRHQEEEKSAKT